MQMIPLCYWNGYSSTWVPGYYSTLVLEYQGRVETVDQNYQIPGHKKDCDIDIDTISFVFKTDDTILMVRNSSCVIMEISGPPVEQFSSSLQSRRKNTTHLLENFHH